MDNIVDNITVVDNIPYDETKKKLIISPQAGMCNRFRSLASSLFVAEKLNRQPFLIWEPLPKEELRNGDPQQYMRMSERQFTDFFEQSIYPSDNTDIVDIVLTEWLEKDSWYRVQSYGQRKLNATNKRKIGKSLPNINRYNTVMIETSLKIDKA